MLERITFHFDSKVLNIIIVFDVKSREIWLHLENILKFLNIPTDKALQKVLSLNINPFEQIYVKGASYIINRPENINDNVDKIHTKTLFINTFGFYQLVSESILDPLLREWLLSKVYNTIHYFCSSSCSNLTTPNPSHSNREILSATPSPGTPPISQSSSTSQTILSLPRPFLSIYPPSGKGNSPRNRFDISPSKLVIIFFFVY